MSLKENDNMTEHWTQVYDDSSGIQEFMYSIVLNDGWCSNYDDVDQMNEKAYEIFIEDPEYYISRMEKLNSTYQY